MVISFVLMNISPALEYKVLNELSKLNEIVDIHPLFGEYNLMAKVEAKDYDNIGEIVIQKIRTINGIVETKTLTGLKFQ